MNHDLVTQMYKEILDDHHNYALIMNDENDPSKGYWILYKPTNAFVLVEFYFAELIQILKTKGIEFFAKEEDIKTSDPAIIAVWDKSLLQWKYISEKEFRALQEEKDTFTFTVNDKPLAIQKAGPSGRLNQLESIFSNINGNITRHWRIDINANLDNFIDLWDILSIEEFVPAQLSQQEYRIDDPGELAIQHCFINGHGIVVFDRIDIAFGAWNSEQQTINAALFLENRFYKVQINAKLSFNGLVFYGFDEAQIKQYTQENKIDIQGGTAETEIQVNNVTRTTISFPKK